MKVYPELFKGKREILEHKKQNSTQINEIQSSSEKIKKYSPYLWNSNLEKDEFGLQTLKQLEN